ncbi:keratin-associated protein 21-1-like [Chenopodium quinoa]|uniref:keratin-associated protein 21-1-like n=1 Tax=Chenopodium quinoa TaxID=63459 RepID=UPI000B77ED8E|nr:keratin-associated protein 21-1-like [Chenopodium quinoa]
MYHYKTKIAILHVLFFMLATTCLARYNSFGESRDRRMEGTATTTTPGTVSSPLAEVNNHGNEDTPTGATGSAHGPNWDYGWGWGAGPRSGWGYGYGSSHSPTSFGRGYGFGYGSGSGSGSGSGYGYGSGSSGGVGGYGYGAEGAHGGSGGGGSFVTPPNHG